MNTAVRGCVLLRHCRMEFMKHVFPRLLMPTAPLTHGFPTECFSPHRSLHVSFYMLYNTRYCMSHVIVILIEVILHHAVLSYVLFLISYCLIMPCYITVYDVVQGRLVMVVMAISKSQGAHTHTYTYTHTMTMRCDHFNMLTYLSYEAGVVEEMEEEEGEE